jgi:dihydrofolate synthase/folylpolyglutamate synthase
MRGVERFVELTNYIGRWQVLGEHPMMIADSAHNEDALEKVINKLVKEDWKNIHFVIGFVNDKDLAKVLPLFPKKASYYFVKPNINRGLATDILKSAAAGLGLKGLTYQTVTEGIAAAKASADAQDLIYIGGSSFVVAEAI